MRRKELEIMDINEIETTIENADVCLIGLVDGKERLYN